MNIVKVNVSKQMSRECEFCGKQPKKDRIEVRDSYINRYGKFGFDVFCNKTHFRKFVNGELKELR